jgi:hypothetical protein
MRHLPFLAACIALAPLTGGCALHFGTSTSGSQNNVTFADTQCLFGCSVDQPMMLGTEESLTVRSSNEIPAVTIVSSDPSVLSVTDSSRSCCDANSENCSTVETWAPCPAGQKTTTLNVDLKTNAVGRADLVLHRADATLYDSVSIEVARAVTLDLSCANHPAPTSLSLGQSCAIGWTAKDSQGRELLASSGVDLESSDGHVVGFEELFGAPTNSTQGTQGLLGTSLVAVGPGDATISASAGGAAASMTVHVTP